MKALEPAIFLTNTIKNNAFGIEVLYGTEIKIPKGAKCIRFSSIPNPKDGSTVDFKEDIISFNYFYGKDKNDVFNITSDEKIIREIYNENYKSFDFIFEKSAKSITFYIKSNFNQEILDTIFLRFCMP